MVTGASIVSTPSFRLARLVAVWTVALALAGCSMFGGGGSKPEAASTTAATASARAEAKPEQIDVRQFIGPDYCPELRVINGGELLRRYERGHEDDAKFVIWQASVSKTARECLFDLQGGLTLKVGISGRVISGPKGGAATVRVPLKIAVVKYREAVLVTEDLALDVSIPAEGATTFTQVKEILVPSPGKDRDYIIYVGLDVGEWDPMNGEAAVAVIEPPPPPPQPAPATLPAAPPTPRVLPTPTDGFVLQ